MLVSTKGRYALRVMIELAKNGSENYVPLKEIAASQEISEKYLEAIIKKLVHSGLVVGLRGKGGGYKLSRAPSAYTVREILQITEGSIAPIACAELSGGTCKRSKECTTLSMWKALDEQISRFFTDITLDQLLQKDMK